MDTWDLKDSGRKELMVSMVQDAYFQFIGRFGNPRSVYEVVSTIINVDDW